MPLKEQLFVAENKVVLNTFENLVVREKAIMLGAVQLGPFLQVLAELLHYMELAVHPQEANIAQGLEVFQKTGTIYAQSFSKLCVHVFVPAK